MRIDRSNISLIPKQRGIRCPMEFDLQKCLKCWHCLLFDCTAHISHCVVLVWYYANKWYTCIFFLNMKYHLNADYILLLHIICNTMRDDTDILCQRRQLYARANVLARTCAPMRWRFYCLERSVVICILVNCGGISLKPLWGKLM